MISDRRLFNPCLKATENSQFRGYLNIWLLTSPLSLTIPNLPVLSRQICIERRRNLNLEDTLSPNSISATCGEVPATESLRGYLLVSTILISILPRQFLKRPQSSWCFTRGISTHHSRDPKILTR